MQANETRVEADAGIPQSWEVNYGSDNPATEQDGYLESRDRRLLYFRERMAPNADAQVLMIHGVGEHYGRYRHVARYMTSQNIGFSMMDLRGHGQSEGQRAHVEDFEDYLSDLDVFFDHVKTHGKKIFLAGHSLGGLIAIRYVQSRRPDIAGLITSGAALKVTVKPPEPVFRVLKTINKLYRPTPVPALVKPEFLSRDPAVVRRYKRDPLVSKYLTTNFGIASMAAMEEALDQARAVNVPCLVLHGGADKVVDRSASDEFYGKVNAEDKALNVYPQLFHEIFNEPERKQVLGDVSDWIKARL